MEQTIRDLFTQEEWDTFAPEANSALAVIKDLPLHMEVKADEKE